MAEKLQPLYPFRCFLFLVVVIVCLVDFSTVYGKSSLTFVIDDTGSMWTDITQAKESSHQILDVAIRTESSQIENFVLVTFNDPDVLTRIDTKVPSEFEAALDNITVYGGGDCPEMAMTGIEVALRKSLPGSFLYVFSDASAKDYLKGENVRSLAQKKQSRIVFLLSGDCGTAQYQDYQIYHQIAAVSSGQVFRVHKNEVSKVLTSVPYLITGASSVLTSKYLSSGCHNIKFHVDNRINDITVSASGDQVTLPYIVADDKDVLVIAVQVVNTDEIKITRLPAPKPGFYSAKVCSPTWSSVVITAKTEFGFQHGFSEISPKSINDTARQPIEKTKSHLAIHLFDSRKTVTINKVELLDLEENILIEMPVERVQEDFYISNSFFAPKNVFKIAIKGYDKEDNVTIRRISKTAIETQKPYTEPIVRLSEGSSMEVDSKANIALTCTVLGFPAPNITWTDSSGKILIGDLKEKSEYKFINKLKVDSVENNKSYTCTAVNKNGEDASTIEVKIRHFIDVLEKPADATVKKGEDASLNCKAKSVPKATITWIFKGEPVFSDDKYQISGKSTLTIKSVTDSQTGEYQCVVENKFEKKTLSASVKVN